MQTTRFNDSPRQVERYIEEEGQLKGAGKFLWYKALACAIPTLVIVIMIWWKSSCNTKSKLVTQDNASSNRIKEQNNASSNRRGEQDNATKNRKDEISAQSDADLLKIKTANKAKMDEIELREKYRRERSQRDNHCEAKEELESYAEAKANGSISGGGERFLGFPYLKLGYSRAVYGPTDMGKTTYMFQEGIAIARGECRIPLTADWHPIPPVHVIYFSLEQTYEEVDRYWGTEIDSVKSHFHLYCGQVSPAFIVKTVKEYLEISNEYGVVLYIDNGGKLEQYAYFHEIVKMNRELEQIRQTASKNKHPLTVVKVYHTGSKYDETKPFSAQGARGDKNRVNLGNDVMFITGTSLGDDKRIVGFLKNKHCKKDLVNIVEFAGTEVDQFRYVGQAKEVDVLCSKNQEYTPSATVVFDPHKVGRKPTITYEEAFSLQMMVTRGVKTWRQILAETGHSKQKVKECIKRHWSNLNVDIDCHDDADFLDSDSEGDDEDE